MTVKTLADQTGLQLHLLYRTCKMLGIKKKIVDYGYTQMLVYDLTPEEIISVVKNYKYGKYEK